MNCVLSDILEPGLRLVLVGTAVGERSAERGHYYAGPGNSFWTFLHHAGLTPTLLRPEQDASLPSLGLGLTDLVKTIAQSHDRSLPYDVPGFEARMHRYQPRFVAFTSKAAGSAFARARRLGAPSLGLQSWTIGRTSVYILPSPSGANRTPTDPPRIEWWKRLGQLVAATPDT
jgi:double-stranded uracil-DNA glycosylase